MQVNKKYIKEIITIFITISVLNSSRFLENIEKPALQKAETE